MGNSQVSIHPPMQAGVFCEPGVRLSLCFNTPAYAGGSHKDRHLKRCLTFQYTRLCRRELILTRLKYFVWFQYTRLCRREFFLRTGLLMHPVSIHPPMQAGGISARSVRENSSFNTPAYAGGRYKREKRERKLKFQYTRLCRREVYNIVIMLSTIVSIHPPMQAGVHRLQCFAFVVVSIHPPMQAGVRQSAIAIS